MYCPAKKTVRPFLLGLLIRWLDRFSAVEDFLRARGVEFDSLRFVRVSLDARAVSVQGLARRLLPSAHRLRKVVLPSLHLDFLNDLTTNVAMCLLHLPLDERHKPP